jgi:hypothetical protein
MRIYNVASGSVLENFPVHKTTLISLAVSQKNNLVVSGGGDTKHGSMMLWNVATGQKILKKFQDLDQFVADVKISSDNNTIVTALGYWMGSFMNDKSMSIKIWDATTGKLRGEIVDETDIERVYFSNNNQHIISVTRHGTITYWDVTDFRKINTLCYVAPDEWAAYTPSGLFDGSMNGIKKLHFSKGMDIIPLESFYEQFYTPNLLLQIRSGTESKKPDVVMNQTTLPPMVEILLPNNSTRGLKTKITSILSEQQNITLSVKATDQGGGIDEVRLYHNGKLLDGTTRGFKSTGQNHEFTVTLTNGENRIKATAFNSQRTESIPDEIVVNFKAPEIVKPNMHILAVGINNYLNPKYNLNYAKNDAEAFVKSLSTGASSLFGKVEVTTINDDNATKTGILAAIEKIKANAKAEDVFVFYYAGHGVMSSGNGVEKPLFYLVPHDVTKMYEADEMLKKSGISATEIGEFSKTIKAQKQLFVIDACQSGGAMQTLAMRGAAEEKAIAQLARSTGTYFIAASGTEQFATEVAELGHGIFTYSVIEALKGSCKSQDGKITVNLLKSCVEDLVPELSKKHKGQPQFPTGYGFGMDFPVVMVK